MELQFKLKLVILKENNLKQMNLGLMKNIGKHI